ncbi:MAG: NAD(P)/FAD-dependent oxidoreductase [Planctomycetota bacterium]
MAIRNRRIHIAGAGLVGSLLAVMLGKRGYDVTILERRADPRLDETDSGRSINLALSSRGIHALRQADLMQDVEPLLIPMTGRMLHMVDGSLELMPYGQRENEVIYSVSRRDLNLLMMDRAEEAPPVNILFEQKVESVDFENQTMSIFDIANGLRREESFQLLIGADGAGSQVRRALMPAVDGHFVSEFLDHDYKELEIPAGPFEDLAEPAYQIEKNALHIWPRGGYMLIALPNQDGSFTVTLFMPKTGPASFETLDDPETLTRFFSEQFPDTLPLIPDLVVDYRDHPQGPLGTVRCRPWYHQDCALILGDASHAIVPFHGQGMNSGFEDCSELIRLLDQFDDDWSKVLPEFDRIRRPNADAIADMAIENYTTMRASVADPKFQLKKEIGFELERRFPTRFIPRYSLVMFHLVPYVEAFSRGKIQQNILSRLAEEIEDAADVDFDLAERLVFEELTELSTNDGLCLSS